VSDNSHPPTDRGHDGDDAGKQVEEVVDRFEQFRQEAEERRQEASEGVLLDQLDSVEERLLSFGRTLGGDVETVTELPFTEEATTDGMPEPLYVRHDTEMLNQVTSWLLQDQHIGLVSPYGTGKSAFREIVLRDLQAYDRFIVAPLENPRETTPRQLYQTIIQEAKVAGYELDTDQYWQTRDGIPWATEEARDAVYRISADVRADDRTILLLVDEIEVLPEELLSPLQVAGDAGIRLFLLGTPEGKQRVAQLRGTLDSRLRYYEGIDPFSPTDVAEYISRSLAYLRGESFEGQGQNLFTPAAIEDIHERTDGIPRQVRIECRELFTRAAFVWHRTGQSIDRIQITPQLRHRRFGMRE
jgi:type II secretory pathway predicted ATPase ExeA